MTKLTINGTNYTAKEDAYLNYNSESYDPNNWYQLGLTDEQGNQYEAMYYATEYDGNDEPIIDWEEPQSIKRV